TIVDFLTALVNSTNLYMQAESVHSESYDDSGKEKSDLREKIVDPKFDNVSVLIMGVDSSEKRENADTSRTDTMMVATLNKEDNSVNLLSIQRNSYVYIP